MAVNVLTRFKRLVPVREFACRLQGLMIWLFSVWENYLVELREMPTNAISTSIRKVMPTS